MRLTATIASLALWAVSPLPAVSQQSPTANQAARAEVLVLGVYHMANPGRDIANTQADDVLSPKRQADIGELIAVLKKFHPTKVAVEADVNNAAIGRAYDDYLLGKHELTRNEIQQIGFRLAKELGHKKIFPVDADGEFPFPRVADYAKAHDRTKEFDGLMAGLRERVGATSAYMASHTVLETLLYMNADSRVAEDMGWHYRLSHLGEPWNWAGADLISDYFRRNMRIYTNIVRLADSPSERVLVIYGSGHLGWLRHNFSSDPTVRLRSLAELAN